jgi:hypothetical protein
MADLAEGTEELRSDVGEDAGAFGGDAIADEEKQEPGQELVDLIGGVKFGELIEKVGGEVVGVLLALAEAGMTEAETRAGIPDGELARMARTGALLTTDGTLRPADPSGTQTARLAPLAVTPFAIALGKLGRLGRGDRKVLRRERVR